MIGRPFVIQIGHHGTTQSEMQEVRLEIEGFVLNSGRTSGEQIGSVDYYTDEVLFPGSPLTTAGGGTYRLAVDVPTGHTAFTAAVAEETGLDDNGTPVPRPGSTMLSFTIPHLPLGAKLQQMALRFNVSGSRDGRESRTPTPVVGATNPPTPGVYSVHAWVRTTDGAAEFSDFPVEIYAGSPVHVRARRIGRGPVRVGQPIRYRITTSATGTPTTVAVTTSRSYSANLMGPGETSVSTYFTQPEDRGRTLRFTISPDSGRPTTFTVRVKR
jgi:hypothetical protein